jgi:CheY-like chemotaxis protein
MRPIYKKSIAFEGNFPHHSIEELSKHFSLQTDEKRLPNIMIIDDDNDDIELLLEIVQSNGYTLKAKIFNDPFKGLKYLETDHETQGDALSDLIILDIYMVVANGHNILKTIKSMDKTADIPVLMYSSSNEDSDIMATYRNKSIGYFNKPIEFKQFYKCIKEALPDFPFPLEKNIDIMQLN